MLFKGSGFYQTDYRSESYKKAAKSETGGPGNGASKDAKTEAPSPAKTETKSEPKPAKKATS